MTGPPTGTGDADRTPGAAARRAVLAGAWLLGLGVAVFVLAGVAVWASPADYDVAVWWPAAGLAVLALVHRPRASWPAVLAVVWVASAVANAVIGGRPPAVAVGLGLANTAEAVVVAWVLLRGRTRATLESLDDVVRLFVATALGILTMGLVGGVAAELTGWGDLFATARTVMASHGAAILVIVPLGMRTLEPRTPARRSELVVQSVALLAAMAAVFAPDQHLPLSFAPLPLLVWGALRQRPRVVVVQMAAVGLLVTTLSTWGGPFTESLGEGTTYAASLTQAYLVMMVLVAMPLSVTIAMRRVAFEGVTASEHLLRTGFSESLLGMMLVRYRDGEARLEVVELNPVAARILGGAEDDLLGTDLRDRLSPGDRDLLDDVVRAVAVGRVPSWRDEVAVRVDERTRWVEVALAPLPDSVGPGMFVVQLVDVSARREAEERLTEQALQDALTGLANRTLLRHRVAAAIRALAPDDDASVAVLFCDLDDFKHVNDSVGHSTGDRVLVEVARRFSAVLGPGDLAARHGGDEFVLLRPRVDGPADAEAFADEVLAVLAEPVVVGEDSFTVGASIGIVLGRDGATPEDLLRDADAAMYAAKAGGRRRAVLFSDEHRARALRAVRLEAELRRALDESQLVVHLQPVVDLRTERVVAAEALVRWAHPEQGLLLPGEWLDVAESCGLMPELGATVLEEACRLAASWPTDGSHDAPAVHVNVSARQLEREGFLDVVRVALERSGLAPERLVLEFTETHLDEVSESLLADLARLRKAGIGLAADDYGTGYSPLTRVIELPISMIKIDRGFVGDILADRRSRAIVTTLVRLGESLGLEVVAEGVETPEQAAALRMAGCTHGQGFLWSRPVPAEQFRTLLATPTSA